MWPIFVFFVEDCRMILAFCFLQRFYKLLLLHFTMVLYTEHVPQKKHSWKIIQLFFIDLTFHRPHSWKDCFIFGQQNPFGSWRRNILLSDGPNRSWLPAPADAAEQHSPSFAAHLKKTIQNNPQNKLIFTWEILLFLLFSRLFCFMIGENKKKRHPRFFLSIYFHTILSLNS